MTNNTNMHPHKTSTVIVFTVLITMVLLSFGYIIWQNSNMSDMRNQMDQLIAKATDLESSFKSLSEATSMEMRRANQKFYMKNEIIKKYPTISITMAQDIAAWITNYAEDFNIDGWLVFSIIQTESNFNYNATSQKNAMGLMQLIKSTAKSQCRILNIEYSNDVVYNPELNIRLGCCYLYTLINSYDTIEEILAEYNMGNLGPEVYKNNANKLFEETKGYILEAHKSYKEYKKKYDPENYNIMSAKLELSDTFKNISAITVPEENQIQK